MARMRWLYNRAMRVNIPPVWRVIIGVLATVAGVALIVWDGYAFGVRL
jgi:hypothetical protein